MSGPRSIFVKPVDKEESNFEEKKTTEGTEDSGREESKQDESCSSFVAAARKSYMYKIRYSILQFVFGAVILAAVLLVHGASSKHFVDYHTLAILIQDIKLQCNSSFAP